MPWTRRSWMIGNSLFWRSGRQREISSTNTASACQMDDGVWTYSRPTSAVGQRIANQVVEIEQAGVVVSPLEAERHAQASQQVGLARTVRPDQQERFGADQRAEHHRLDALQADDPELRKQRRPRRRACLCCQCRLFRHAALLLGCSSAAPANKKPPRTGVHDLGFPLGPISPCGDATLPVAGRLAGTSSSNGPLSIVMWFVRQYTRDMFTLCCRAVSERSTSGAARGATQ